MSFPHHADEGPQTETMGSRPYLACAGAVAMTHEWAIIIVAVNLTMTKRLFVNFGVGLADHEHPRDFRWRSGGLGEHFFPRPMQCGR
jgi:hypothetical protein